MLSTFRLCLIACALSVAALCHADPPQATLPLTPIFFNTQGRTAETLRGYGGPQFAFTFANDTGKAINTLMAFLHSTVVLDGKTYARLGIKWAGNPRLSPMETWNSDFRLADYLAEYAKDGSKWSSAILAEGQHTLTFKMDGKTYGPTTFIWKSSVKQSSVGAPLPNFTLVPIFFNTQGKTAETISGYNGPQYAYTLTNNTKTAKDIMIASGRASVFLDGKLKHWSVFIFWGNSRLRAGDTWNSAVYLSSYLTFADRSKPKWDSSVLAEGSHALAYTIDGKIYGPVTFIWHTQAP